MKNKTNSKKYLEKNYPELLNYKRRTSRRYEKVDRPNFKDNWWLNLMEDDLDKSDYIVFAGAMDYNNEEFKVLKIPSEYLKSNIHKIDVDGNGWINIYVHFDELIDLRNSENLSFKKFALN